MDIPNFGDLVVTRTLDGEKLKLEDIVDKPITVIGYRVNKSKYTHKGTEFCTTLQFTFDSDPMDTQYVVFTGSSVIREQIEEIEQKLDEKNFPHVFRTTVKKIGNYHALT